VRVKQSEHLVVDAPHLRIVDEKLVKAVRKRQQQTAKTYIRNSNGSLWGRPGMSRDSKFLLTGMAHCACCGANLVILGGSSGHGAKRKPIHRYGCSHFHNRGRTVCANDHKADMQETNSRVITAIEQQIFTPGALAYTVEKATEILLQRQAENPRRPQQIERELKKLRKELDRFMTLIASGNAPAAVMDQITRRETRIKTLEIELSEAQVQPFTELDRKRLSKATSAKLGRFTELLHGDIPLARQALRKLLAEPMQFQPVVRQGCKTYSFSGVTKVGALLDPDYIGGTPPCGP
jgi:DNA repair exonuclease SbcCD ATPase subunit